MTFSGLNSLNGEKDFFLPELAQRREGLSLVPQLAEGVHLLPLDALRTFSLSRPCSLEGEEVFYSFSPALARGRGGLLLFPCLKTHESVEVFDHRWCLRSPKDDEDFKTFNWCRQSPKNDGDFKTFNWCYQSSKNDGDFKTFNDAANRRKTMGTLNFYLESMQHNFKLALNHVRVIRSFF